MTPHEFKMTEGKQESGMLHNQLQQGFEAMSDNPLAADYMPRRVGDLPGFDSEAHRAFMRSLG